MISRNRAARLSALLLPLLVLGAACRDEGTPPVLSAQDNALLREKADARIGRIVREFPSGRFDALVVFRGDVFLTASPLLEQANIPVHESFGNAAILLIGPKDILPLAQEPSVRKIYYFCRQGPLARFHPSFLFDALGRFGAGRETSPVPFLLRFQRNASDDDVRFVEEAGLSVLSRTGPLLTVIGPPAALPALLENDGIVFYEGASDAGPP